MAQRIGITFFMKDTYPLFNPACSGVFGGAEVDLYLLARELARTGRYEVSFFVGDYGQPAREVRENVRLVKLPFSNLERFPRRYHKVVRRLCIARELIRDRSAVLLTKTASDTLGYMVLINKFLKGRRVLFKCGSDIDADIGFWKKKSRFIYMLYSCGLRFVDHIICQSIQQQRLLDAHLTAKSLVIKNGFPVRAPGALPPKDHILWVSRYDYMKRPELFVQLARALPQERFLMIMPGKLLMPEDLQAQLRSTANLTCLDGLPFDAMQQYFDRAKCFVNTSEFEGFPNTFIQAGLGATPILSFAVNPDDVIGTYRLGCFCRDSLQGAVDFLQSLDAQKIADYGTNALRYVTDHHDLKQICLQYDRLIRRLALPGDHADDAP